MGINEDHLKVIRGSVEVMVGDLNVTLKGGCYKEPKKDYLA